MDFFMPKNCIQIYAYDEEDKGIDGGPYKIVFFTVLEGLLIKYH
jgi:hypothetical protein